MALEDDNGWIKQNTLFKPKQVPWKGRLLSDNKKVHDGFAQKSFEERRFVEKQSADSTPSTSTSSRESQKIATKKPVETRNLAEKISNKAEPREKSSLNAKTATERTADTPTVKSVRVQQGQGHKAPLPPAEKTSQRHCGPIDSKEKEAVKNSVDMSSIKKPERQVQQGQGQIKTPVWPPPAAPSTALDYPEESNRWSLGQSERRDIMSQLENVIGNSKRLTIENDKENDNEAPVEEAKSAPKNITKDTLKKLLELEKEEQEARLQADQSNAVIKCGLPETQRPKESENRTDIEKCIKQLKENDPNLKEVNLNNMKRTPAESVQRLLEASTKSTHLKKLSFVNVGLNDNTVEPLLTLVESNPSLESINLETNYLTGNFLDKLFASCLKLQTLHEIKAVNQSMKLGAEAEHGIVKSICQNRGFHKVSVDFRSQEARQKVDQAIIRNGELRRLKRKIEAFE